MGVEVKLWPIYPGEMELQLTYDPAGAYCSLLPLKAFMAQKEN